MNWTAANSAAAYGRPKVVRYLVSKGASVTRKDKMKRQILHYAAKGGSVEAVKFLVVEKECSMFLKDR